MIIVLVALAGCGSSQHLVVASKHFNESYLLAEIMSQLLEDRGISVDRRYGLGGTMICFQALVNGEIDLYPEYSGTLEQAILKLEGRLDPRSKKRKIRLPSTVITALVFSGKDNTKRRLLHLIRH